MMERIIKANKIRIGDISISFYIKNALEREDQTVIFLHGFPFNKNSWREQLESLEDNITGIAIDIRGHGLTTSGHGFFSVDVFAKDLGLFIEKLKLKNVVLCGVSMGGYIALRAYELFSEKITGLILSDTHHRADDNIAKQKRFDSIAAILEHGRRPFAIGFIGGLLCRNTILNSPETVDLIKSSIRRNSVESICATQLALASRTDSTHILAKITVPTLIVRGAEDKITPKTLMEEMHSGISGADFVEVENAGHLPNLENVTQFNRLMNDFILNKIKRSG